jgi:hypothetical protein
VITSNVRVTQVVPHAGAEGAVAEAGGVRAMLRDAIKVDISGAIAEEAGPGMGAAGAAAPAAVGANGIVSGSASDAGSSACMQPGTAASGAAQGSAAQHGAEDAEDPGVLFPLGMYEAVEKKMRAHKRNLLHHSGLIPKATLLSYR